MRLCNCRLLGLSKNSDTAQLIMSMDIDMLTVRLHPLVSLLPNHDIPHTHQEELEDEEEEEAQVRESAEVQEQVDSIDPYRLTTGLELSLLLVMV